MNEKTKAHFIEQMRKTQEDFNALMLMFAKHVDEEWVGPEKGTVLNSVVDEGAIPMDDVPLNNDLGRTGKPGFKITCSRCGGIDTVPFEPKYASKVYCSKCFKDRNGNR